MKKEILEKEILEFYNNKIYTTDNFQISHSLNDVLYVSILKNNNIIKIIKINNESIKEKLCHKNNG